MKIAIAQLNPIIGNFSGNDHNADVFATLYVGAESSYSDFYQLMILDLSLRLLN